MIVGAILRVDFDLEIGLEVPRFKAVYFLVFARFEDA